MNNYRKDMDKLYQGWKKKETTQKVFISDGVVCPEEWFSQSIRPMFLCKEAYSTDGDEDWDLVTDHLMLQDKSISQMWKRVSCWTEGLFKTDKDNVYPFHMCKEQTHYGNEWLRKIAVVNVKKSGGKSRSSMKNINEVAKNDRKELLREIEICDPTIIICGYTISSLNIIMDQNVKDYKNPHEDWIYTIMINNHPVTVIDYYHPANQYPDLMNYYGLMNLYQLSLRKWNRMK